MMRQVKHATFHSQSNFVPNIGEIGKTLPSKSKTLEALTMSVSEVGLHVYFKHTGAAHEVLFPIAAISHLILEPEESESLETVRMKAKLASMASS